MDALKRLFREYNLLAAAFTAFFAMALGLEWITLTSAQIGLVLGFIAAILLIIRFLVTPVSSPELPVGTKVNEHNPNLPTTTIAGPAGG